MKVGKLIIRSLEQLDWLIGKLENVILITAVLSMALLNIGNVLGHNLFGKGFTFSDEINQALLVIITFVGVAKGARHGRNIRMSAMYDQFKGPWRKGLNIIITTGSAVVLFYLAYLAVLYEVQLRDIGQTTPALGIPLWLIYLVVPFGLFIAALQYSMTTLRNLTAKALYRSYHELEVYEEVDLDAVEDPAEGRPPQDKTNKNKTDHNQKDRN